MITSNKDKKTEKNISAFIKSTRYITDDVTSEKLVGLMKENNERMAILSSEGGLFETLSGRYHNIPNLDVFLKGYTWDYLVVDRMHRSETLQAPALTIGLFVQPTVLQGLPARLVDRGLLGRFLYVNPESLRGRRNVVPKKVNSDIATHYFDNVQLLLSFETKEPITLSLDDQAEEIFLDYIQRFEYRLKGDLNQESMKSWTERLPGHLLRIASLIHIVEHLQNDINSLDSLNNSVGVSTMQKILGAAEYFIEHAKKAFGCIKTDEELEDAKYLWDILLGETKKEKVKSIIEEGEVKRQAIWKKTKGKFTKAETLNRALYVLIERGYVRTKEKQNSGRGRTGTSIEINPIFLKQTHESSSERLIVESPQKKNKPSRKLKTEAI
jgi:hypothetical protein